MNKTYQTFVLEVLQCLKEDGLLHYNNDNFYLNMDELANELLADIGCNLEEESEAIIKITTKQEIGKLKHFFNRLREQMKAHLEKMKQQKSEEKLRTEFKRRETESKMAGNINNQEKVIAVKKRRFFQYFTMFNFNYLCRTVCL